MSKIESELLDFAGDKVIISEQLLTTPEFQAVVKKYGKKSQEIFTWIFFIYSRKSIYFDVEISDRRKIVSSDRLGVKSFAPAEDKEVIEASKKFVMLQYSKQERLLNGIDEKIDEYLEFFRGIKIGEDNHRVVSDAIKNSDELLALQEKIKKRVLNEQAVREHGGGESTLFEN